MSERIVENLAFPVRPLRRHLRAAASLCRLGKAPRSTADRLLVAAVASLAGCAGLLSLAEPLARLSYPVVYLKDVLQMYLLGTAMREGVDPFAPIPNLVTSLLGPLGFDIGLFFPHPTPHPPTLGLLAMPLTFLDYPTAAGVWFVLELSLLWVSIHLLGTVVGVRLHPVTGFVVLALGLTWDPVTQDLGWGQLDILLLALATSTLLALRAGRQTAAGVLLGTTLLVKQVFWPVVLLLAVRRQWRAVLCCAAVVALGYGVVGLVVGFDHLAGYFVRSLPATADHYKAATGNMSLWSLGWRLFGGTNDIFVMKQAAFVPPVLSLPELARVASFAVPGAVLASSLVVAGRSRYLETALGIMVCVSIAVSPIAWRHYLVLASLPAVQLLRQLAGCRFPLRETLEAAATLALLAVPQIWEGRVVLSPGLNPHMSVPVALVLVPTFSVLWIGVIAVRLESRERGQRAAFQPRPLPIHQTAERSASFNPR